MPSIGKIITTSAVIIAFLYILLFLFGWFVGKKLVFPMPASSYQSAQEDWIKIPYTIAAATKNTLPADTPTQADATQADATQADNQPLGGEVVACIVKAQNPKGYILYQHGNGEDLGTIQPRLQLLAKQGWSVLAWDYPGYGLSPGTANEESVSAAVRAVARYAQTTLGWPVTETVIYGRSVGGGPSILLATEEPYKGLILEGTFTSAFRVATRLKLMPFDVFDNWARIDKIKTPVLFMHGTRDRVVPFAHSTHLLGSAPEPKYHSWFKGGGHNNLPEDFYEQYQEAVGTFLENLPTPAAPNAQNQTAQ